MEAIVSPGTLAGSLAVPASKSMMQRALAGALLHKGYTTIHNPGNSADDQAALSVITQSGATIISQSGNRLHILSDGIIRNTSGEINCGESGLSCRLFTPIAAISKNPVVIKGHGTLAKRSMSPLADILPQLGVQLPAFTGHIPFTIKGPLKPGSIKMNGSTGSQYLTGTLFALAFTAREKIVVEVEQLKSKPYTDMTLEMLELFGKKILHQDYRYFNIDPTLFRPAEKVDLDIEADWSSAAFWLVAGAISGTISLKGMNIRSLQADRAVLNVLEQAGADIKLSDNEIRISKTDTLQAFSFDATDSPDLFPCLAVLALFCGGTSSIKGLHRLAGKESNRTDSICEMLTAFGAAFSISDDTLQIAGVTAIRSCKINGHQDHRIVMAAAVAALRADGPLTITGADAVSKSYPLFFDHLSASGSHFILNHS